MILVELIVPSMDETYDFMLDEHTKISQLIGEIDEVLSKKTKQTIEHEEGTFMLCSVEQKKVLPHANTLSEHGIKDGCRLMLI